MKHIPLFIFFSVLALVSNAQKNKVLLPNGWAMTPAGTSIGLGDLPLNMAISRDSKYIAVTNNGVSTQTIQLIDAKTHLVVCSKEIAKSWLGLKFSNDSKYLYASGGNDNRIMKYAVENNKLDLEDIIVLSKKWPRRYLLRGLISTMPPGNSM